MTQPHPLESLRQQIDRIDHEFLELLAERMQVAREIGSFKRSNPNEPLRDDERERRLLEAWTHQGETRGLSSYFVGRILREILNYSRRDQERLLDRPDPTPTTGTVRVGFQGADASYSDLAVHKLFTARDGGLLATGYRTFRAVADALEHGEVDYAFLPVENTIAGSINEVYRILATRKLHVVDEEVWKVEHCLVGLPGAPLKGVRVIRSHPVALQQCQRFLESLPGVVSESCFDTAAACGEVAEKEDPSITAIASEEAAHRYGLEILHREVADQPVNLTRFLLIGLQAEPVDHRMPAKTSLILSTHHHHGALAECLQIFARQGLNLSKLESRPRAETPFEYLFYVDVEGAVTEPSFAAALEDLRQHTHHLRVLGSYPNRSAAAEEVAAHVPAQEIPPPSPAPKSPPTESAAETIETRPVRVGNVDIGGPRFVLMAGPCAVESRRQILDAAEMVKRHGATILRGGAFKPRSSPYSFQGLGFEGLAHLAEAGRSFELPVVTEVLRAEDVEKIAIEADMLQVGARNMQNFELLKEIGKVNRPVLLKRGMSATIKELLLAAEYVMAGGNQRVVLCERGIRTFETATRNTLDVSAIPVLRERTHLPVVVDPSHAAGRRSLVLPLALAAVAAGADGLIVECHPNPCEALCDKEQALTSEDMGELRRAIEALLKTQGRSI